MWTNICIILVSVAVLINCYSILKLNDRIRELEYDAFGTGGDQE